MLLTGCWLSLLGLVGSDRSQTTLTVTSFQHLLHDVSILELALLKGLFESTLSHPLSLLILEPEPQFLVELPPLFRLFRLFFLGPGLSPTFTLFLVLHRAL